MCGVLRPLSRIEVGGESMPYGDKDRRNAYDEQYLPNMLFIDFQMENQISNVR